MANRKDRQYIPGAHQITPQPLLSSAQSLSVNESLVLTVPEFRSFDSKHVATSNSTIYDSSGKVKNPPPPLTQHPPLSVPRTSPNPLQLLKNSIELETLDTAQKPRLPLNRTSYDNRTQNIDGHISTNDINSRSRIHQESLIMEQILDFLKSRVSGQKDESFLGRLVQHPNLSDFGTIFEYYSPSTDAKMNTKSPHSSENITSLETNVQRNILSSEPPKNINATHSKTKFSPGNENSVESTLDINQIEGHKNENRMGSADGAYPAQVPIFPVMANAIENTTSNNVVHIKRELPENNDSTSGSTGPTELDVPGIDQNKRLKTEQSTTERDSKVRRPLLNLGYDFLRVRKGKQITSTSNFLLIIFHQSISSTPISL